MTAGLDSVMAEEAVLVAELELGRSGRRDLLGPPRLLTRKQA